MKKIIPLLLLAATFVLASTSCKKKDSDQQNNGVDTAFTKTITFPSTDTLLITADHYHLSKAAPVIVLCHQAGYSRGEYKEIALTLNQRGYNCLAIDQRSGDEINGVANETAKRAKAAGKGQTYLDAKQDIEAAIKWAKNYYNKNIILWGSSYSSALAVIIAGEYASVEKVLAFSPGEYLGSVSVKDGAKKVTVPAFITSSQPEQNQAKAIFDALGSSDKTQFIPTGTGVHGAKALWTKSAGNEEYWTAVNAFLPKVTQ